MGAWMANVFAVGMWNVRWMRMVTSARILIYAQELAFLFIAKWLMSSVYNFRDLVIHHAISIVSGSVSIFASLSCEVGESMSMMGGSWFLINLNEVVMFTIDICGQSQKDSTISMVRRLWLVIFCGVVTPCITVGCVWICVERMPHSLDAWRCWLPCVACSLCALLMQICAYPAIVSRSMASLYGWCKGQRWLGSGGQESRTSQATT